MDSISKYNKLLSYTILTPFLKEKVYTMQLSIERMYIGLVIIFIRFRWVCCWYLHDCIFTYCNAYDTFASKVTRFWTPICNISVIIVKRNSLQLPHAMLFCTKTKFSIYLCGLMLHGSYNLLRKRRINILS